MCSGKKKEISKTYCTPLATPLSSIGFFNLMPYQKKVCDSFGVGCQQIIHLEPDSFLYTSSPLNTSWNKKIPSRNGAMNQSITQEMYSYTISVPRGPAEKCVCLPGISSVPPLVCLNRSPSTWTFGHRTSEKQNNQYTIIPREHILLEAAELTKADLGFVQALHILNTFPLPYSLTS